MTECVCVRVFTLKLAASRLAASAAMEAFSVDFLGPRSMDLIIRAMLVFLHSNAD